MIKRGDSIIDPSGCEVVVVGISGTPRIAYLKRIEPPSETTRPYDLHFTVEAIEAAITTEGWRVVPAADPKTTVEAILQNAIGLPTHPNR